MDTFYDQIKQFSDIGSAVSMTEMLFALSLAFLLSLVVSKTYQFSYRGVAYSPAFMHTLVLCTIIIAVVMLIIGSNIARAFSLVGALSIIRFRNAVKDPRDVAFIFYAMAVGMACGTGFFALGIVFTIFTSIVITVLSAIGFGEQSDTERILRIEAPAVQDAESLFREVLKAATNRFSLLSMRSTRMGTELELTYSVHIPKTAPVESLITPIMKLNNQLRVEVLSAGHQFDL
ncbi:MAG: DUF4956 domain-containing protein [Deltaproteobacteria bacterium]|nr:DUF4956 domain-containing protein [Deltaproteobacteria bacterium]